MVGFLIMYSIYSIFLETFKVIFFENQLSNTISHSPLLPALLVLTINLIANLSYDVYEFYSWDSQTFSFSRGSSIVSPLLPQQPGCCGILLAETPLPHTRNSSQPFSEKAFMKLLFAVVKNFKIITEFNV